MKIYIIERNEEKFNHIVPYFDDLKDVILINGDFKTCMDNYDIECIVSPANSYGIMTGGYDKAIIDYFGNDIQNKVQNYIIENYYGEQPVATSFIIDIDSDKKLIHTPTMRVPKKIKDERVVYQCMRTTLMLAKQNNVKSILIPLFGSSTGGINPKNIAIMMRQAYDQIEELSQQHIKRLK